MVYTTYKNDDCGMVYAIVFPTLHDCDQISVTTMYHELSHGFNYDGRLAIHNVFTRYLCSNPHDVFFPSVAGRRSTYLWPVTSQLMSNGCDNGSLTPQGMAISCNNYDASAVNGME